MGALEQAKTMSREDVLKKIPVTPTKKFISILRKTRRRERTLRLSLR